MFQVSGKHLIRTVFVLAVASLAVGVVPQTAFADNPPAITYFAVGHLTGEWWEIYGTIDDEDSDDEDEGDEDEGDETEK